MIARMPAVGLYRAVLLDFLVGPHEVRVEGQREDAWDGDIALLAPLLRRDVIKANHGRSGPEACHMYTHMTG